MTLASTVRPLLLVILLCVLALQPAQLHADAPVRPRLFLIVCDCLTFDDLRLGDSERRHLTDLVETGCIGLMNCATPRPNTEQSAMLTIAVGAPALGDRTDEHAANDWEKAPGERVSAAESYRHRRGLPTHGLDQFSPEHSVKHLGIVQLQNRGFAASRIGALLASASPPVSARVVGNADTTGWRRRATLLTLDGVGGGAGLVALHSYNPRLPYGLTDSPESIVDYAMQREAQFTVLALGDGSRAENARPHLNGSEYNAAHDAAAQRLEEVVQTLQARLNGAPADIVIISARPPGADATHPHDWNRLTPIIASGPHFPPGSLISPTTRTSGLVANSDIAPTILQLYGLPIPTSMVGRPMQDAPDSASGERAGDRIARVARLELLAWANSAMLAPFLAVLGVLSFLAVALGLTAIRAGRYGIANGCAQLLLIALNFPAAQLFAPLTVARPLVAYGLVIGAWMLGLAIVENIISRLFRISAPAVACLVNIAAVVGDLVSGQHLIRDALISNYYLPGFRYYGIGNDYLGLMVGMALIAAFAIADDRAARIAANNGAESDTPEEMGLRAFRMPERLRSAEPDDAPVEPAADLPARERAGGIALSVIVWIVMIAAFGWPGWGANSGSLIVCSVAFTAALCALLTGRTPFWSHAVGAGIGLGLTVGFAWLDARYSGAAATHAGTAIRVAAAGGGWTYLLSIAVRKLQYNASLFAAPWTWVTASLCGGALLIGPLAAESQLNRLRKERPWLRRAIPAVGAAAIAALLVKDTGVVTACYLGAVVILVNFYYLLSLRRHAEAG